MSPPLPTLSGLTFSIVGPGAVGESLSAWLIARGAVLHQASGRPGSARLASFARRFAVPAVALDSLATEGENLLLLAVPDAALEDVANRLAARPQAAVVVEVSGVADPSILAPLRGRGSAIGGLHPLRAFPAAEPRVESAAGQFFALGGDPAAIALGRRLAAALGGTSAVVTAEQRPLYHLVASLMAGGVTTVVAAATEIAAAAGLSAEVRAGFSTLALDALRQALGADDPARGITGPAARGDQETLLRELAALDAVNGAAISVVVALARETLRQRARLAAADPAQEALRQLLDRADLLDLAKDRVLTSKGKPSG
ncbi:MAG: Rossmann-like and DUF2520 domain-containing protein [Thermoanaerobaculia bacterium]